MSTDIYQRLTIVETRLGSIEKIQGSMADDLRVVRDHMVAHAGARKAFKAILSFAVGVLAIVGAAWKMLKGLPPDFIG